VSPSLLLPLHQVGKLHSWEDFQDRQAMTLFTTRSTAGTTEPMSSAPRANGICSWRQFGVSPSLLLPLHQVGKLHSWEDFQDRQAMTLFTTRSTAGTTEPMSSAPRANGICSWRQFGVSPSLLLPLHQVGKLHSWEDFQDRQAMTLFTTRSTAGTTEPMSSAPRANGICSWRQFGVSPSLLLPLHQVGKLHSWEDFQDRQAMTLFTTRSTAGTTEPMSSAPRANGICSWRQFGVSPSLLLPLHQVGKLHSWEDFQDRQAMTLFTTRSTAGTTEPMSSAPRANGICSWRQFGVSPSLLLPLHQVGKLHSWEDFQDRQAMTLFTTRSTAGTTEPM